MPFCSALYCKINKISSIESFILKLLMSFLNLPALNYPKSRMSLTKKFKSLVLEI